CQSLLQAFGLALFFAYRLLPDAVGWRSSGTEFGQAAVLPIQFGANLGQTSAERARGRIIGFRTAVERTADKVRRGSAAGPPDRRKRLGESGRAALERGEREVAVDGKPVAEKRGAKSLGLQHPADALDLRDRDPKRLPGHCAVSTHTCQTP